MPGSANDDARLSGASGDWSDPADWNSGTVPDNPHAIVTMFANAKLNPGAETADDRNLCAPMFTDGPRNSMWAIVRLPRHWLANRANRWQTMTDFAPM